MRSLLAVLICLALCACDPFAALGSVDEEFEVPQNQVAGIELIVPERRLPPGAHNVRMRVKHFQDTIVYVRFDAPTTEARSFAERLIGRPLSRRSYAEMGAPDGTEWWISTELLNVAEKGEDRIVDGDGLPSVSIALIPHGDIATVWLKTFTT